mgnify:CR=1 FL=1
MTKPIRRVAVIGAGVMGSGIAAHCANSGLEVLLLDIVPPGLSEDEKKKPANRNKFAINGKANALKAKPAAFFHPTNAELVRIGNTEDDLAKLANVDLVIEAIIEKIEANSSPSSRRSSRPRRSSPRTPRASASRRCSRGAASSSRRTSSSCTSSTPSAT